MKVLVVIGVIAALIGLRGLGASRHRDIRRSRRRVARPIQDRPGVVRGLLVIAVVVLAAAAYLSYAGIED